MLPGCSGMPSQDSLGLLFSKNRRSAEHDRSGLGLLAPSYPLARTGQDWPSVPARTALSKTSIFSRSPGVSHTGSTRPDVLDLEPAVTQAELILAVRLVDVTETKIVHGGRDVQVTEQYRFEPVRVLKGIFARESLLLDRSRPGHLPVCGRVGTAASRPAHAGAAGPAGPELFQLQCCAPTLGSIDSAPGGQGRPALPAVEALIGTTRLRDRVARVELLRDASRRPRAGPFRPCFWRWAAVRLLAARAPGVTEAILPYLKSSDGLDPRGRRANHRRHARRRPHGAGARPRRRRQGIVSRARDRRSGRRRAASP